MSKKVYRIFSFTLVVAWMFLIFFLSAMDSDESNYKSKKMIDKAIPISAEVNEENNNVQENDMGGEEIQETSGKSISPEEKAEIVNELNGPLRKCMHASVYFVLSLLLFNFLYSLDLKNRYLKYFLPIIVVFLYACTDEYHQTFVVGRSGEVRDVLIDTLGGTIGCVLIIIGSLILKTARNKKNSRKMSNES